MNIVKVINRTRMRESPSRSAPLVRVLEHDTQLLPTGQKQVAADAAGTSEEWQQVKFIDVDANVVDIGWVRSNDIESSAEVRPPVDRGGFVRESIIAERTFNNVPATAPWLVSANYIIARALIETGITNVGPSIPGSDGVGPLQVSTAEWKLLLDTGNTYGVFDEIQRESSITQIYGAGFRMHHDAKAISDLKTAALPATRAAGAAALPPEQVDRFIPNFLDVFNAYLSDSPAAAVSILNASNDPARQTTPLDAVLTPSIGEAEIAAFFTRREKYTGTRASPKSVKDYVAAVEADLNSALKKAYDMMKESAPEELMRVKQGEASWFDVALEEETKKIDEDNAAHKSIILDYFKATSLGRPRKILPWCGAFAAHCMQASNNPVPDGAAAARSWKSWGVELPVGSTDVPRGAVIVLSPSSGTGTTGHVGFFVQFVDGGKKVELLGGNQSDKLNRTLFSASKIAAIRWIDSAPVALAEQFNSTPSDSKISKAAFDLIVEAEVTSKALYEQRYRGPIWPGLKSGVTIGIGYDVGQTNAATVQEDWTHVISDAMLHALKDAVGVTGPAAQQLAARLKGQVDIPFDAAILVHSAHVIPRWIKVVENALGNNTSLLSPDSLGALVSLTYNRGASFSTPGDRYTEMRNIKRHIENKKFAEIPGEFRAMKRIWPSTSGLQTRREREAVLFERGLAAGLV
jgi:uncharacterized protein (TIGR02594 family)